MISMPRIGRNTLRRRRFSGPSNIPWQHPDRSRNRSLHRPRTMATLALARQVPTSFPQAISMNNNSTAPQIINYQTAVEEHETYVATLRQYLPVVCLPPLPDFPDSMFVEDTIVTRGKKAVITNPGHQSRRSECATIQTVVQDYLGMTITSMQEHNQQHQSSTQTPAYCDGGDVLSLGGNKLFVGINGTRTNYEAVPLLEDGLAVEVIPIPFTSSVAALHLKSILTHVDEHTVLVPDTELGTRVVHTLMQEANVVYEIVTLPSHATLSCNVVVVPKNKTSNRNGLLMAQLVHEEDHKTRQILHEVAHERALDLKVITAKEAAKADGALTCCSVLLDL